MSAARFGIAEWYGESFMHMKPGRRRALARVAQGNGAPPRCPFQVENPPCNKSGGVCSFKRYESDASGRLQEKAGERPVVLCPQRFEERNVLIRWLAGIFNFPASRTQYATEVPFMHSPTTGKAAGKIDLVIARSKGGALQWYGLEIQAVYFSGPGMQSQFKALETHTDFLPPFPDKVRRPDWRSSSAKRLMPQLQIKAPTVRRWGSKLAVAVDRSFFDAIGGPSSNPSHDPDEGDIVWLVPEFSRGSKGNYELQPGHWEVMTLEESSKKLLAAETLSRSQFEEVLREKLRPL